MISPEGRLPGTRAEEGSVLQAFGAHPSVVMDWDEKARLEGVAELCSRLRTEAARVVAVGEIGIDTLVVKSTAQLDRQVAFLTALVKALMESSDLKHLPLVLHVREGDNTRRASSTCITILKDAGVPQNHKGLSPQFSGRLPGGAGLVEGISQRYVWGMSSVTAEASSEASTRQGRVGSLIGGDRCSIPAQSDPGWTTS